MYNRMIDFSLIIVSYNNHALLKNCLESVYAASIGHSVEIIVVDNNSDAAVVGYLEQQKNLILIKNSQNKGFGGANNQGAKIASGKWLVLLNNDTIVPEDFFAKIVSFSERFPRYAIMGPLVLSPDRMPQPTFFYKDYYRQHIFPSAAFRSYTYSLSFGSDVASKRAMLFKNRQKYNFVSTHEVEVLSGVCLCIDRKVYENIGLFDEHYFMYVEDMDFCLTARRHGYALAFFPELAISHFIKPMKSKSNLNWSAYNNNVRYFFRKNFPWYINLVAQPVLMLKSIMKQFIVLYNNVSAKN